MSREDVVGTLDSVVNAFRALLRSLPDEQSLRLSRAQQLTEEHFSAILVRGWAVIMQN